MIPIKEDKLSFITIQTLVVTREIINDIFLFLLLWCYECITATALFKFPSRHVLKYVKNSAVSSVMLNVVSDVRRKKRNKNSEMGRKDIYPLTEKFWIYELCPASTTASIRLTSEGAVRIKTIRIRGKTWFSLERVFKSMGRFERGPLKQLTDILIFMEVMQVDYSWKVCIFEWTLCSSLQAKTW